MRRTAFGAALAGVLALAGGASAQRFPDRYDTEIEGAAARWWPGLPWRLWKAQLWQESRLNPNARSPVGALGLAQFMPGTWAEISRAMGMAAADPRMAGPAIEAGAFYMAKLRRHWSGNGAKGDDTQRLAQASYNAGQGNIRRAARACAPDGAGEFATAWAVVATCLPAITGRHSAETLGYVRLIAKWHLLMETNR